MARLVCALLLLTVATASASESRIVGGYPSSVENYPSIAQIERSLFGMWRTHCAGIILTAKHVLSTCSCAMGPDFVDRLRRVRAGSSIRSEGGQVSDLSFIIKNPMWNQGLTRDGDLAIFYLMTPLQYTHVVQQATILGQGAFIPDNMPAVQLGWGATFNEDFPSIFSKELRQLDVITVNNQRCAVNYATLSPVPLTVTDTMLCAGSLSYSGACLGDRGSPLYIQDIVVGLVSWGLGCTNSTFPTVHTSLPSFTNWIVDNVF